MQQQVRARADLLAIELRHSIEALRLGDRRCPIGHPICAKDLVGRALKLRCPQAYAVCEPVPNTTRAGL